MSESVDEAVCDRAREAMVAARRAEFAVLEAVRELESAGVAQSSGYRSLEALAQDLWRVDLGEARRLLRQARAVCGTVGPSGEPVQETCPAAGKAAANGTLDREHVRVIDEAVRYLEKVDGIDPDAVTEAEQFLAEKAAVLAPRALARVAAELIAAVDQDGVAPEEEPEPTDELRIGRRRDGSLVIKGRFRGRADIDLLCETFDALSGRAGTDDERDLAQRYAETLLDLCAQAGNAGGIAADADPAERVEPGDTSGPLEKGDPDPRHQPRDDEDEQLEDEQPEDEQPEDEQPEDDDADDSTVGNGDDGDDGGGGEGAGYAGGTAPCGPNHAGTRRSVRAPRAARAPGRPLFTVTMPLNWLTRGIGHGLLGDETPIHPEEARRLACDAGIIPMILGSRGEPLDVGRLSYSTPEPIRRALIVRDRGCSFPGCHRRPGRCHAHHVDHWLDGGPTALDNLTLLCRYHHHLVHHGGWQVVMRDGRPWFTPPRWIDPQQLPRPGGPVVV